MDSPTDTSGGALADFAATLRWSDVPAEVASFTRLVLLDAVGCLAIGARAEDTAAVTRALAALESAQPEPPPRLTNRASIAASCGYAISASSAMDSYTPAAFHTTPAVVGSALSFLGAGQVGGQELLCAVLVGLEASIRIADGLNLAALRRRGWHTPGVVGPLGASLTAGKLAGSSAGQLRHGLGLAGSQAAGTFAAWGTPTVKFHQARGALAGVLAASIAAQGFTSSADIIGAEDGGMADAYADRSRIPVITAGLGDTWRVPELTLRAWPTAHGTAVTAVLDLLSGHPDQVAEAEFINVEVAREAERFSVFARPQTRFEAMNSIPLAAATALLSGDFGQRHIQPSWYQSDDVVKAMNDRVHISTAEDLRAGAVRVFPVPLKDPAHVVECVEAVGSTARPIGRKRLVGKFIENTSGVLDAARAAELAEGLLTLGEVSDVAVELPGLLRIIAYATSPARYDGKVENR